MGVDIGRRAEWEVRILARCGSYQTMECVIGWRWRADHQNDVRFDSISDSLNLRWALYYLFPLNRIIFNKSNSNYPILEWVIALCVQNESWAHCFLQSQRSATKLFLPVQSLCFKLQHLPSLIMLTCATSLWFRLLAISSGVLPNYRLTILNLQYPLW